MAELLNVLRSWLSFLQRISISNLVEIIIIAFLIYVLNRILYGNSFLIKRTLHYLIGVQPIGAVYLGNRYGIRHAFIGNLPLIKQAAVLYVNGFANAY